MVIVGSGVTSLNPLKIAAKLLWVQGKVINETSSLVKMAGEQAQSVSWGNFIECKYIKLPVVLSILQARTRVKDSSRLSRSRCKAGGTLCMKPLQHINVSIVSSIHCQQHIQKHAAHMPRCKRGPNKNPACTGTFRQTHLEHSFQSRGDWNREEGCSLVHGGIYWQ